MSGDHARIIRRHQKRTDDGKGLRRHIAGRRFRLPAGVEGQEADERFLRIEKLWKDNQDFCLWVKRRIGWTDIALWAAEYLRRGEVRVPLPPTDVFLRSYDYGSEFSRYDIRIERIIDHYMGENLERPYPASIDGFMMEEALTFYEAISDHFPSVSWLLPARHRDQIIESHRAEARYSLERLNQARNLTPPDPSTP